MLTWMQWFRQLEGHEFLLPVSHGFLEDKFNVIHLGQLKLSKDRFERCRALMFRQFAPTDEEMQNEQFLSLN
jgi:casein kinase II subunit beta